MPSQEVVQPMSKQGVTAGGAGGQLNQSLP